METTPHPVLHKLCYQAKNLYNRAMFLFKEHYELTQKYLTYQQLNKELKNEDSYKVLPAHTAQHTLKLLVRNWKNFSLSLLEYKNNSKAFLGPPRPPRYKRKNGQQIAIFSNQQSKIREGKLVLPRKVPFTIKTRLTEDVKLKETRIIPRGYGYTIELVYSKHIPKITKDLKNLGAIDLGIKNLITYVDNINSRPIVVKDEGKGIKSIIQYYLKEVKKLQKQYAWQQKSNFQRQVKLKYGTKFHRLRETKRRKVNNWIHQISNLFVHLWVDRGIQQVYIGYNPLWKHQLRLRKKTTQMFVIIPFNKLIQSLKYKAEEHGIIVQRIEESYTSKCSFLDNEFPQRRKNYAGKRKNRGIFESSKGIKINADVNGAYNILLKGEPQALPPRSVGGVGGYVIYPLRWSFEQQTSKKKI